MLMFNCLPEIQIFLHFKKNYTEKLSHVCRKLIFVKWEMDFTCHVAEKMKVENECKEI
jgi:hypothetical protein